MWTTGNAPHGLDIVRAGLDWRCEMVARAILKLKSWSGSKRQPHNDLVRSALEHLAWKWKDGFFWSNATRAIYDEKQGIWRKGVTYRGPADIIGVFHGMHVEFEAKTGRDTLKIWQRDHRDLIQRKGGFYYVFHDTKELESAMADIEARIVGISK